MTRGRRTAGTEADGLREGLEEAGSCCYARGSKMRQTRRGDCWTSGRAVERRGSNRRARFACCKKSRGSR
eukprot:4605224-Pleurochrysis_carterae.AAC.1